MFELQQVTVSYGEVEALAPTDLAIAGGDTVVLMGPSGSGKSTLLRTLAGLTPYTGTLTVHGEPVRDWQALRRTLGYVIQDGGLFPHLTARENVSLMARELGWSDDRIATRVNELSAMVGLETGEVARFPAELSGGQRQRVAMMRALMLDPEALLLDEPLSALDPITRVRLAEELRELFARLGKTVVIVTHSLGEARFFARDATTSRAVLMRDGRIVQQGAIERLHSEPADDFVREFVSAEEAM